MQYHLFILLQRLLPVNPPHINAPEELQAWLLSISSIIIVFLLTVLVFLLKRFITSVDDLKTIVGDMDVRVHNEKTRFDSFKENHVKEHMVIDRRLNDHASRLDDHSKAIAVLKIKKSQ